MSTSTPAPLAPPTVTNTAGLTEAIAFPELDIYELYQFIDLLVAGRSPEIVELCARRNREWVKSVAPESYRQLINYFIRRNFTRAMEIAESDPIAGLKVGPLLMQMGAALQLRAGLPSSVTQSLAVPSGASSPATPPSAVAAQATPASASATPPASSAPGSPSGAAPTPSASST